MWKIKESLKNKKFINHVGYITNPIPTSYAAYVLLKEHYSDLSVDFPKDNDWRYLFIMKRTWLRHRKDESGTYTCEYCGKGGFVLPIRNQKHQKLHKIITLDHITPMAKGGPKYDTDNWAKACHKCNSDKGDKILN